MANTELTQDEVAVALDKLQDAVKVFRAAVYDFARFYEADQVDLEGMVDDIAETMFGLACDIGTHFGEEDDE